MDDMALPVDATFRAAGPEPADRRHGMPFLFCAAALTWASGDRRCLGLPLMDAAWLPEPAL
jgi:hypothetical protein